MAVLKELVPHLEIFRQVVFGLYAVSFLNLLANSRFILTLNIFGVLLNVLINTNPLVTPGEAVLPPFMKNLAIVGGLLVLLSVSGKRTVSESQSPAATPKPSGGN